MAGRYDHINFKPPSGAIAAAKRGLRLRREFGRGGTEVGVARARDISNGRTLSTDTWRRVKAFFDRHASDSKAEGFRAGEPGYPSNGLIAHLLWGGNPMRSRANRVVAQMNEAEDRSVSDEREVRLIAEAPAVEVRKESNGKTVIRGRAALYDSFSRDLGGFREVIKPGAFKRAMESPDLDVLAKLDHDRVLARSTSGTLELELDEKGLRYTIHPKRADADVVEAIERGDITGSSFAFRLPASGGDTFRYDENGNAIREIREFAEISDISVVHNPAYPETNSYVSTRAFKALGELRGDVEDVEDVEDASDVENVENEEDRDVTVSGEDDDVRAEEFDVDVKVEGSEEDSEDSESEEEPSDAEDAEDEAIRKFAKKCATDLKAREALSRLI